MREFEPAIALFGGDDGWRDIRVMLDRAPTALSQSGRLMMEIGYGQSDRFSEEIRERRDLTIETICADLQGIQRLAIVRRS